VEGAVFTLGPVSDPLDTPSGDKRQLGSLLELLHRADAPFRSVEATYRIWRHEERASAAWRAGVEEEKRRGAAISTYGSSGSSTGPVERGEVLRIWRADDRVREEHEGGPRDGAYGVRDGELWWSWDEGSGAISNQDDPKVGSGIGDELLFMLDPTPLLGSLRFAVVGRGRVAGRETVSADAVPRLSDPRRHPRSFELDELGGGADRYRLEVDAQLGGLLEVIALRDGKPFHKITTLEIEFDHSISEERFHFQPPAGEEIQPTWGRHPERLSLREAQQRAPFTVLIPDRIPSDWHMSCLFLEASDRPRWPGSVALIYGSDDGHESVSLSQLSAADKSSVMLADDEWEDVVRDGRAIRATRRDASSEAQAQLEHDGTFVILTSQTLTRDQLATIAAGLKPAPSTSSI
jgi:hypothetical protein